LEFQSRRDANRIIDFDPRSGQGERKPQVREGEVQSDIRERGRERQGERERERDRDREGERETERGEEVKRERERGR
jgi:hypothetical protein